MTSRWPSPRRACSRLPEVYRVELTEQAAADADALPAAALAAFAELRVALELAPWAGDPWRRDYPDRPVRSMTFSVASFAVYLILEHQRRVEIVQVVWVD